MSRGRVTGWRRDMVGWWAVMNISGERVERNGRVDGAAGIQEEKVSGIKLAVEEREVVCV